MKSQPERPVAALTLVPPKKPSLAVLPFVNMSGDAEQAYFADGMTEDIITSLSKLSQLMVIARNSSFTYKGRPARVQQVGQELGVAYVIEGGVRKAANRVRITAQLIDCATGGHLWADRYDRDLTDIFAIQDEVTAEIVAAMAVTLTSDEQQRLVRKGTDNLEAYDCLLRAREQWWELRGRELETPRPCSNARSCSIRAFRRPMHGCLMFACKSTLTNGGETERPLKQSCDLAKTAVALDEADPDGHNALGCAYLWLRQHDMAIAEYERTIALDPNNARAHVEIGWVLHYVGRSAEALPSINRGMRLDTHTFIFWRRCISGWVSSRRRQVC